MSRETKSKVSKVEQPTIEFIERWKTADGVKDYSTQSYRRTIADLVDNYLTDLDEGNYKVFHKFTFCCLAVW
ncbi:serine/threonine-protein kinase ATR [Biomphalaria pfeifferi]|uniref:Serine/threonine-protein kinase ATR n=1 Tax=Biomphalaria pfeifferi TaxID=112525 RepID=A0AAD8B7S6_BIOPF|nr:serine/threonine-protein kinase ATR [Biomphalaria pfeifferi]